MSNAYFCVSLQVTIADLCNMIERNFRTQNPGIKYSFPATILEQRLLFFSWLPSSFAINSFSEPKVKVIDAKYKSSEN